MLPPTARLRRREDFLRAGRAGRRAAAGGLVVHLAGPAPPVGAAEDAPVRVGFVVPKAVGGAVVRNLVVRRLRHLVRARLDELPVGSTVVVRALPSSARRTSAQLGLDLTDALTRLHREPGPVHRPSP